MPDHDEFVVRVDAELSVTQQREIDSERAIARGIEEAIGIAASIEEEQMLEAAELLEIELGEN